MISDFWKRRTLVARTLLKRIFVWAILPAASLLLIVTLIVHGLKEGKIIRPTRAEVFERQDQADPDVLTTVSVAGVRYYRIVDSLMLETCFPVRKPRGTFRIVIAGSSFIMGSPYMHQNEPALGYGDIPGWIRAELSMRFPSIDFEVINAGIGAGASRRILGVAKDLLRADPDLVVIATGDFEGLMPDQPFNEALRPWVMEKLAKGMPPSHFEKGAYEYRSPGDPELARLEAGYEKGIVDFIGDAKRARVPVVISTMPINAKYQADRITYANITELLREDALVTGLDLMFNGKYREAVDQLLKSRALPLALRYIGECCEALGDRRTAMDFYMTYTEHMPYHRTRPSLNAIVRRLSETRAVPMADMERALERVSPDGIPDPNYFGDAGHMNWQGYYLMGQEVLAAILKSGAVKGNRNEPLPAPAREEIIEKFHFTEFTPAEKRTADLPLPVKTRQRPGCFW